MPLTNPNKVVTEERLSEFYGQILPYMGGMPDVLANKFSKGDLYSTDEKMVGVWTDGKPLYQKTYTNLTVPDTNSNTLVQDNVNFGHYNVTSLEVVKTSDMSRFSFGVGVNIFVTLTSNNKLGLFVSNTNANRAGNSLSFTIQYTKTTDSPIAIGSDTDYSTDEKIVGTWIDGRPIWQKTVSTGGNVPSGATLILRTAMASTGYDTILYTKTS